MKLGKGAKGEALHVPQRFSASFDFDSIPYVVKMEIAVQGGIGRCRSLTCEPKKRRDAASEITSEELRRIPVARLLRWGLWLAALEQDPDLRGSENVTDLASSIESALVEGRSYFSMNDDHLRVVAEIYRAAATATPDAMSPAPVKALAEHFEISRSTATRWVRLARERGFLSGAVR